MTESKFISNNGGDDKLTIKISSLEFDPLIEPPNIPKDLQSHEKITGSNPVIIQFKRSLSGKEQATLKNTLGLKLMIYFPNYSYLEKINLNTLNKLRTNSLFRAVFPYHPAFKISSNIGKHVFESKERKEIKGFWLTCVLFNGEDPYPVAKQLEEYGASNVTVVDDRMINISPRIHFIIYSLDLLKKISFIPQICTVDEVPDRKDDNVNAAGTIQSGTAGTQSIWNLGLNGENQVIGIMDSSPIDINHCFFRDSVVTTPGPSHRKVLDIRNSSSTTPTSHATFVAGCAAGDDLNNSGTHNRRGGAWAARLVSGNRVDLNSSSLLAELTLASAKDAVIHSNSWHDDTAGAGNPATYNQTSADVDTFTWNNEDHLILGSAGNTGEEQGPPGTAKNAICVSASQADPNEMNFGDGNNGPTADGRRKPDLTAVGCSIQSATVNTTCTTGPRSACATSYATPHTAAAAALIRQYYTEGFYPTGTKQPHHSFIPSGALLKATLLNSTIDMTTIAGYPNNQEGWGLILLDNVLHFPGDPRNLRIWDTRNIDGTLTGETRTHHIDVATNTQPLKITLVWSDPPAAANSANPTVNNLDLEVISPDGTQTFLGNVFAGGASTTGGAADTLNNVEMILVNNPTPGDWTIRVVGTEVNVGNPGQGYALVATADLTEPPVTTGVQDTLVVRVKFNDVAFEPSLPNLQNMMTDVNNYINEVSYGQTTVVPAFRGPISLDHNKDYYYHEDRNLLIELTEEVVSKLVATEPNLFDNFERMIIVTNDINFNEDWATTGTWPYELPAGFTQPISVSVQSYTNSLPRFTHGMLHQFGLVDLYAHEGVTFPRPYVDEWDNMGGFYNNVHPLVWSKERAGWLTAHGDTIQYIPRPAAGATYGGLNPIPLFRNTSTSTNRKGIAIGLSQGAATLANEDAFYFIETRDNSASTYDESLPGSGVVIYYVNELIPQGEGSVILRDKNLLTQGLADAVFGVGDTIDIPGTGIQIIIESGTGGADFNIQVNYTAPVTDYNVFITRGDTINGQFYSYFSPDIWVDSPRNGFDLGGGPPPHDQRDHPVAGQINRIYARIHNAGPATAYDFDVRFRISEPYHTVGGEADFDKFVGIKHIDSLASGAQRDVYVEWTPETAGEPHACVKVDLINLVGTDTNVNDNWAQENLQITTSVAGSPFHPVTHSYNLTNPYDYSALFYFRAEDIPKEWTVNLEPRKIKLNPGERIVGKAIINPSKDAKICTSEWIQITSWTPRGDTLINVGGGIVQVDLRRPTTIELDVDTGRCDRKDLEILIKEEKEKEGQKPVITGHNTGFTVTTDRLYYRYDDKITISGKIENSAKNKPLALKIYRPNGDAYMFDRIKMGSDGSYSYSLNITKFLGTTGQFKIVVSHNDTIREVPFYFTTKPRKEIDYKEMLKRCRRIYMKGCTSPPIKGEEIILKYVDPLGNVTYRTVKTDENGCFEDFFVNATGGAWQVSAEYPGNDCQSRVIEGPITACVECVEDNRIN